MKKFLRHIGKKIRELFGSGDEEENVGKYLSTNANGKVYVDDLEGYLEAGNCFDEMERTAKVLRKDE